MEHRFVVLLQLLEVKRAQEAPIDELLQVLLLGLFLVLADFQVDVEALNDGRPPVVDERIPRQTPFPFFEMQMPVAQEEVHAIETAIFCELINLIFKIRKVLVQILLLLQSNNILPALPHLADLCLLLLHLLQSQEAFKRLIDMLKPSLAPVLVFFGFDSEFLLDLVLLSFYFGLRDDFCDARALSSGYLIEFQVHFTTWCRLARLKRRRLQIRRRVKHLRLCRPVLALCRHRAIDRFLPPRA